MMLTHRPSLPHVLFFSPGSSSPKTKSAPKSWCSKASGASSSRRVSLKSGMGTRRTQDGIHPIICIGVLRGHSRPCLYPLTCSFRSGNCYATKRNLSCWYIDSGFVVFYRGLLLDLLASPMSNYNRHVGKQHPARQTRHP